MNNQELTQEKQGDNRNATILKFDPKLSEVAFSAVFSNFDKCPSKVASDLVSGAAEDKVALDVCVKIGDSTLNVAFLFDSLPAAPVLRICAVLNCILQPTGKKLVMSYPARL